MPASINKFSYWRKKIAEIPDTLEPLTMLMIRTTDECSYYGKQHSTIKKGIVNTKDINILHAIDTLPALNKFLDRRKFLIDHKKEIIDDVKKYGAFDMGAVWLRKNTPFSSINDTLVATINPNQNKRYTKFITCSGVGRIAAIQAVFPAGVKIKIDCIKVPFNLQKRLVAVNNLYLYGDRFQNLKKYHIDIKEISITRGKYSTSKNYGRKTYLKSRKKRFNFFKVK
tara:strand:+ start:47 stop:724 length:678 start_codon:yes stop_codon:yes gene_type:complete